MRLHRLLLLLTLLLLTQLLLAPPLQATEEPCDIVLVGGRVYTMDPRQPWAQAVGVRGGRIAFVGSMAQAEGRVGVGTRRVDLGGRMVMPGFVDGHNHFVSGPVTKRGARLAGARDKAELLARVRAYVAAHPKAALYPGYGWDFSMFSGGEGTRQELDAICRDRPILLFNDDTHHLWFNTRAMELAGIDRKTPDVVPGSRTYRREADGTPSGIAIELESWLPLAVASGFMGQKEMLRAAMEETFPQLSRHGITAYHDMGMYTTDLAEGYLGYELLREWEEEGRLPCRVAGVYGIRDPHAAPAEHVGRMADWSRRYASDLVRLTGLKIWADGTFLSHTGVQLEPYADRPDTRGSSDWTVNVLVDWIRAAHEAGFDVHIHVEGDGSVRRSLDAFERAGPVPGRRDALHHLAVVHPLDVPRFRQLGVSAGMTPVWLTDYRAQYRTAMQRFGADKMAREFGRVKDFLAEGVSLSFGSDIPGTDPDELAPLYQVQAAVTGLTPDGSAGAVQIPPELRPSLEQMLEGYTMGGARQMRMEDQIGSLEVGKLADLIVLERNLFEVPPESLATVRVDLTMLGGRVLHGKL